MDERESPGAAAVESDDADAPEPGARSFTLSNAVSPLARRLQAVVAENGNASENVAREPAGEQQAAVAAENRDASLSAVGDRLQDFVNALRSEEEAAAEPDTEAPAPPPRVEQEQELREDLQTIAAGLRADAEIESRRTAEQASDNSRASSDRGRTREVQQNRREIQSLQDDRRRAQQEAQRADQAIRQLQSRNARIQAETNGADAGTSLDLLAQ